MYLYCDSRFLGKVFRKFLRHFRLVASGLLAACVTVQSPEGGPPDESPPRLVRTIPENGSVHFKGKEIVLWFDKAIATTDMASKWKSMPRLEKAGNRPAFTHKVSGKKIKIKLRAPLKAETTYSMRFDDAVKDTREGLRATDATLTFSTGGFLDPIAAKGQVKDLLTNKPVEGARVYLYDAEKGLPTWDGANEPDYDAVSDREGKFALEHVRLGQYYVRATTGTNESYKIDYAKDKYGFFREPLDLTASREAIVLPLVAADVRDFSLLRVTPQKGYCEITSNKPIASYELVPLQALKPNARLYAFVDPGAPHTICACNASGMLEGETLEAQLTAKDALGGLLEQRIAIRCKEGKFAAPKLTHRFRPRPIPSILPQFKEVVSFNKPLQQVDASLVYFEGEGGVKIFLDAEALAWDQNRTRLTIRKHFSEQELKQLAKRPTGDAAESLQHTVALRMEAGACIAFDREKSPSIEKSYVFRNESDTGTIAGTIETERPYFRIELLNERGEVVASLRNQKQYRFAQIPAGTYSLRALVLQEGGKKWSPGNIRQNVEPDPVFFYEQPVVVVAGWDAADVDFKF